MKNKILFSLTVLIVPPTAIDTPKDNSVSYLIGGIIALLIMGYLVYTLLKPEKF